MQLEPIIALFATVGAISALSAGDAETRGVDFRRIVGMGGSLFCCSAIPKVKAESLLTILLMEGERRGCEVRDVTALFAKGEEGFGAKVFVADGEIAELIVEAISDGGRLGR